MYYRNYTVRGRSDGFGCQLNGKLSGIAYCENMKNVFYIHTPFRNSANQNDVLDTVSHGWRYNADDINNFLGIPDNRHGKKIHVSDKYNLEVFNDKNQDKWYTNKVLSKIRKWYWSSEKPQIENHEIVVHIRRGDIQPYRMDGNRYRRFVNNLWYNKHLPEIIKTYPDHYRVSIFSEGVELDFSNLFDNWPEDIKQRTFLRLSKSDCPKEKYNLLYAYHSMVSAKVLVMSKSGMSYTSGIYNENIVYYMPCPSIGQKVKHSRWLNLP